MIAKFLHMLWTHHDVEDALPFNPGCVRREISTLNFEKFRQFRCSLATLFKSDSQMNESICTVWATVIAGN